MAGKIPHRIKQMGDFDCLPLFGPDGNLLYTVTRYVELDITLNDEIVLKGVRLHILPDDFKTNKIIGQDVIESLRQSKIDILDIAEREEKQKIYAAEDTTLEPFTHEKISVMFHTQKHMTRLIHITGIPIQGVRIGNPSGITEAKKPEMYFMNDTFKEVHIKKGEYLGTFDWAGNTIEKDNREAEKLQLITHISQMEEHDAQEMQKKINKWKIERKTRVKEMNIKENDLDIAEVDQEYKNRLIKLLNNRKEAFSSKDGETGMSNYQYSIEFKANETGENHTPPLSAFYVKNYNYSAVRQNLLEGEIKKLLEAGTISYSSSPSNLPTVLIVKIKDDGTKKVRLCIDFTKLNKQVSVRKWAIQSTQTILRDVSQSINNIKKTGTKKIYFILSDVTSAFSSIHIDKKTKLYTTFSTKNKSLCYNNMPFGIASAPASWVEVFTRITSDLLDKYDGHLYFYMDDIIVLGDIPQILQIFDELLERFTDEGIILNIKKSSFFHQSVEFLGKIISTDGIKPSPKNVQKLLNFDKPKTLRNTQKLLGICAFLAGHIQSFKVIADPLYKAIGRHNKENKPPKNKAVQDKQFKLTPEENNAWVAVKELANRCIMLEHFDALEKVYVVADSSASHTGYIAGNLYTNNGVQRFTVCFVGSFKMHQSLINSSSKLHEAYGLLNTMKILQKEIQGATVTLYSDNKSAISLIEKGRFNESDTPRTLRYLFPYLLNVQLEAKYIEAKSSVITICDAISRNLIRTGEKIRTIQNSEDWPLNLDAISKEQRKDAKCMDIIKLLENGKKFVKNNKSFKLEEGILKVVNSKEQKLIVIPDSLTVQYLTSLHLRYIHPSTEKMIRLIQNENIYLFQQNQHVQSMVQSCFTCQIHSRVSAPKKTPIFNLKPVEVFSQVHMDLFVITNNMSCEYRYVLLAICGFSDFLWGCPLEKKTPELVAEKLTQYIQTYNVCNSTFVADNGTEFSGPVIDILKVFNNNLMNTRPYNPTSNSCVERRNSDIKNMLKKLNASPSNFGESLNNAIFAFNNIPTKSGYSPFQIVMARGGTTFLHQSEERIQSIDDTLDQIETVQSIVADIQIQNLKNQLYSTETPRAISELKRLDFVLVLSPQKAYFMRKTNKLSWSGPYIILNTKGRSGFQLQDIFTGKKIIRNVKFVKKLILDNKTKREIKNRLTNLKTSSMDPDLLNELIRNKLDEKERIDREIEYLVSPMGKEKEKEKPDDTIAPSVEQTENISAAPPEPKPYKLRNRKNINYRE